MKDIPLDTLAEVGSALAHPDRLRILTLLAEGGLYVCQIRAVLGLQASTASAHLAALRRADLATEERRGKWVQYDLTREEPLRSIVREILHLVRNDPQIGGDAEVAAIVRRVAVDCLCRSGVDLGKAGAIGPGCRRQAPRPPEHPEARPAEPGSP